MFEQDPPFTVEKAFYQKWKAGVKDGGSGINIHIEFENIQPDVVIQNIYFQQHVLEAKKSFEAPNNYTAQLIQNSEKRNFVMDSNSLNEAQNTPSPEFPFQLKENEGVISYWHEGERNYYKIHNLSEKRELAYPQAPPHQ